MFKETTTNRFDEVARHRRRVHRHREVQVRHDVGQARVEVREAVLERTRERTRDAENAFGRLALNSDARATRLSEWRASIWLNSFTHALI